jgi:hypothetical protein
MTKRTEPNAVEMIAQRIIINACGLLMLLGMASFVGSKVYVEYEDHTPDREAAVMDTRPNAPGTDRAVWETHKAKCWRYKAKGQATGAILRINPNDPFVYTRKQPLVERALDQAINHTDRGLDRVLAFCTDTITQKGR